MTSGGGSAAAKLFYQSLIASYVDSDPHFVERAWLAERIERHLHDPACRFVLLTAEPGAGKTALMAWLARRRPDALRYFIRRDSQTPLSSGDAQSLLFTLGQQLAVLHPDLFHPDKLQVAVTQRVEEIAPSAVVTGIRVADLCVSPFYATALRVEQDAGLVAGELIGVDAARVRVEDRLLDCENLQHLALLAPALALASADPAARIVVLIDALDELRYQVGQGGVLDWLASCPELPESLRIIVSSRPDDEQLARFRAAQQRWLREESIDHDSVEVQADLGRFIERVTEQPLVATALAVHRVDPVRFTTRAVAQADGNFQYLVALARAIEQAVGYAQASDYGGEGRAQPDGLYSGRDLERLLRFEGVPFGLENLYAFFLKLVRDSVKDDHVEVGGPQFAGRAWAPAWPALYQPILGLLAVAQEPLGASQLREFADIQAGDHWLQHALGGLGQFLERDNGRYHLYHASFAEFITATSTRTTHPDFYLDPTEWHGRVVEQALATHRAGRSWPVADGYVRAHLATHAAGAGRLDELLEDPIYLAAANPDRLLRVLPAANASRALTAEGLVRRVGSRLRGRPIGRRAAVLELAARQLGANWMAGPLAELPLQRPWSARWAHSRPTSADRLLGTHDGQVNAVALGERDGRAVVVSAGHDGMVRVWDLRTNKPLLAWRHGDGAVEAVAVGGVADGSIVVSGGEDGKLRCWSLADGMPIGTPLTGHHGGINSVTVGDLAGRQVIVSGGQGDLAVHVWDLQTGQLLHVLELESESRLDRFQRSVHAVATRSYDGQPAVIAGHDHGAHLWTWTGTRWVGRALVKGHATTYAVTTGVLNGQPIAVCGDSYGQLRALELPTGTPAAQPLKFPVGIVGVAAGDLNGHTIAVTGNYFGRDAGTLRVWDLNAATLLGSLVGHHAGVKALAITQLDGRLVLVSGGFDHDVRVWDLEAGLHQDQEVGRQPHNHWLLPCEQEGRPVVVSQSLLPPEESSSEFTVAADDTVPVGDTFEKIARRAQMAQAFTVSTTVWALTDGSPVDSHGLKLASVSHLEAVGVASDEVFGVSVGERALRIWDLRSGAPINVVPTGERFDPGANIAIGAVGDRILVAFCDENGRLEVWNVHTAKREYQPLPTYGRGPAACWAFGAPAGRPVAVVGAVGEFGLWDLQQRKLLAEPPSMQREAHMRGPAAVGELAGHPAVVYSNYGRPILIWDIAAAREHAIHVDAKISTITIAPDSTIVAGGPTGLLALRVEPSFFDPIAPH